MQSSLSDLANTPVEIRDVLLQAGSAAEAIRGLYLLHKGRDRKYSLPFLCRQAGIPSTGYLSDVMSGKRRLNAKHKAGLAKAFGLSKTAATFLRLLVDLGSEKKPEKRAALEERLAVLRKALDVSYQRSTENLHQLFFALEVFCAFGLFHNRPTPAELASYFRGRKKAEIDAALAALKTLGFIADDETEPGRVKLLTTQLVFAGDERGLSHFDFLRLALAHAGENLERWFPEKRLSHFESSILSVRKEHFLQVLPDFKARLLMLRSDLESGDADLLIRMNVQLYPV